MTKLVHFLGIGGSGASAAAQIAQAQGFEVTGCDLEPNNEFTTKFKKSQLLKGHNPKHLDLHPKGAIVDILAVTPAIFSLDPQNPEVMAAKDKDIPVLTWQQFLGEYLTKDRRGLFSRKLENKFVIAICGTHGKTTTTAMIAKILEDAELDPTVLLGAIAPWWGTNYRIGGQVTSDSPREALSPTLQSFGDGAAKRGRKYLCLEADEFNDNFLSLHPDISVVTNIEMDHPEYFKDLEVVKESFKKFLLQTKQIIVANLKDLAIAEVMKSVMKAPKKQITHGRSINENYLDYSKNKLNFLLKVPGEFNKLNAQAAMQVGFLLGIEPQIIQKSLSTYSGVGRRFEHIGKYKGAEVYSDFGHHPTEIKVTMEAARQKFPNQKIFLIYEPHMYSRTKALFDDFVKVFREIPVDKIIITDIYPSREVDTGLINSQQLADTVGYDRLVYHSKNQLLRILKNQIQKGDILFFMGAGEIDKIAKELVR